MDASAQIKILHTTSGRTISESAELLNTDQRNVGGWLRGVIPTDSSFLSKMQDADQADNEWVKATVTPTIDFIEGLAEINGAPAALQISYFRNGADYQASPRGYAEFGIPYRQYLARMVRLYTVLSYLGYRVEFSYIPLER